MKKKSSIDYKKIQEKLLRMEVITRTEAERFIYGLSEIEDASREIYENLLLKMQNEENIEKFDEIFWDIVTAYKHILYHIKDGNLTRGHFVDSEEE